MNTSQVARTYREVTKPGKFHVHGTLQKLENAGMLNDGYMVYEREGETRIACGQYAKLVVTDKDITLQEQDQTYIQAVVDPIKQMEEMLNQLSLKEWTAYGYLAFDIVKYYHSYTKKSLQPDLHFFIPRTEYRFEAEKVTVTSLDDTEQMSTFVSDQPNLDSETLQSNHAIESTDQDAYMEKVAILKEAIKDQKLTKAIISRAVGTSGMLDVLATYQLAKHINTSARSYAFELDQAKGVGCSPEFLLYAEEGQKIVTNPLAGTRKRGKSTEEDNVLCRELYHSSKEVKEHALSVLLAQEEISSVCEPESVRVFDFMNVKKYRTVQHLSSRVGGDLQKDKTVYDALKVLFPGITVSGINKKESIEWIEKLEEHARGIYAGSVGFLDNRGNVDLAIAIRSVYQYGGQVMLNAGAGIVEESDPEFEYLETYNKMNTMKNTVILR